MAPLLAEGLEPDRVSGTKAWRVGIVILHPQGCLQSVKLSSAFWLVPRCPNFVHVLLVLGTLSCKSSQPFSYLVSSIRNPGILGHDRDLSAKNGYAKFIGQGAEYSQGPFVLCSQG